MVSFHSLPTERFHIAGVGLVLTRLDSAKILCHLSTIDDVIRRARRA